jgi:hypothetical protein
MRFGTLPCRSSFGGWYVPNRICPFDVEANGRPRVMTDISPDPGTGSGGTVATHLTRG